MPNGTLPEAAEMPTNHGFVKMSRTPDIIELIEEAPLAFTLAAVIALRARFRPGVSLKGLHPGEAFLGDYEKYGMKESQYRTAKEQLEKWQFATFKATNKGTVARLLDTRLFDVLNATGSGQDNAQSTDNQRLTKNGKKEKNGKNDVLTKVSATAAEVFSSIKPSASKEQYESDLEKSDAALAGGASLRACVDELRRRPTLDEACAFAAKLGLTGDTDLYAGKWYKQMLDHNWTTISPKTGERVPVLSWQGCCKGLCEKLENDKYGPF